MRKLRLSLLLAALAIAAAFAAVLVAHWNPTIDGTSRGDNYPCLAPYDTVLNDASNSPGGDPAPDNADIAVRCRAAGEARFDWAIGLGLAAAAGAAAAAVTLAWGLLSLRRDPAPLALGRRTLQVGAALASALTLPFVATGLFRLDAPFLLVALILLGAVVGLLAVPRYGRWLASGWVIGGGLYVLLLLWLFGSFTTPMD